MNRSMRLRTRRVLFALVSLLTLAAWFAASNHCAFAGMIAGNVASVSPSGHENCPEHSSTSHKKKSSDSIPCCKSLQPTAVDMAKKAVTYDSTLFALHVYFVSAHGFPSDFASNLSPLGLDTGPPGAGSFAEAVLQRSILAHAPPVLS